MANTACTCCDGLGFLPNGRKHKSVCPDCSGYGSPELSRDWKKIVKANELWFAPDTISFWNSHIHVRSLTPAYRGWLFVTSEDNADRSKTLFSVRYANPKIETIEWQSAETYEQAMDLLNDHAQEFRRQPASGN